MVSFGGLASSGCMLFVGFLVGHFELHTTVPTQLVTSFSDMEHKVRPPCCAPPCQMHPALRLPAT
jgi:hypothetical protein